MLKDRLHPEDIKALVELPDEESEQVPGSLGRHIDNSDVHPGGAQGAQGNYQRYQDRIARMKPVAPVAASDPTQDYKQRTDKGLRINKDWTKKKERKV